MVYARPSTSPKMMGRFEPRGKSKSLRRTTFFVSKNFQNTIMGSVTVYTKTFNWAYAVLLAHQRNPFVTSSLLSKLYFCATNGVNHLILVTSTPHRLIVKRLMMAFIRINPQLFHPSSFLHFLTIFVHYIYGVQATALCVKSSPCPLLYLRICKLYTHGESELFF